MPTFERGAAMRKEDEVTENRDALDDDLLDFEFDELIEEGLEEEDGTADEEVLELVDVVEEEALSRDSEPDEEPEFKFDMDDSELRSLVEEEGEAGESAQLVFEDLAESEFPGDESDMKIDELTQETAGDLETTLEVSESEEAEFDFEETAEEEPSGLDAVEKDWIEGEPEPIMEGIEEETLPDMVEPAESKEPDQEAISTGISEDRIEAIIREVVEDVVERVARETMAEVAEKLIGEAIDSLKQSLESLSE